MGVGKTSLWLDMQCLYLWHCVKTPALLKPELGEWKLFTIVASGKENSACDTVQKEQSLASSSYIERAVDFFFHLLLFQAVESFSNVKEAWKLEKWRLHRQSLRRRKQVANTNTREITCVFWVEQWLGRTALWLTGLTNSQQSSSFWRCLPVLSVLVVGAPQEWSMRHSSGPAPAAVESHSMAEKSTISYLVVWDVSVFTRKSLPSKICLVVLSPVTGLDSSMLLVDPFYLSQAAWEPHYPKQLKVHKPDVSLTLESPCCSGWALSHLLPSADTGTHCCQSHMRQWSPLIVW